MMQLKVHAIASVLLSVLPVLLISQVLHAQVQVHVNTEVRVNCQVQAIPQVQTGGVYNSSTAVADILRARADAVLALRQAELIHERAVAQRLENFIRECDVAYKRMSTRNQMQKEHRRNQQEKTVDNIRLHQELAEIRSKLETKAAMEHRGIGNLADEMNLLLEKFTQSSFNKHDVTAMQTELSPEQLQAIYLTDGSNTFTAVAGATHLETLKWPYLIRMAEFDVDREAFENLYEQALQEGDDNGIPRPETIVGLLEKTVDIETRVDGVKLSTKADLGATEMKWRSEAKNYLKQITESLNNYSNHDSDRLEKYAFTGKTVGDLLEHMVGKGLRFANPKKEDRNLYASVFFLMRFAFKDASPPVGLMSPTEPIEGVNLSEKEIAVDLGSGVKLEMVLIPAGEFMMGGDVHPKRRVTITKPFYLGKYEVTQEQWHAVMGSNPSKFQGASHPVEQVSWNDCQTFLNKLNVTTGGNNFRFTLPTEAQWEYACRAGSTTMFSYGDDEMSLGDYAWYNDTSGGTTHPVGEKIPNAFGLFDMHGNVWEWCQDWYGEYPTGAAKDPQVGGLENRGSRVNRGGSWSIDAAICQAAYRYAFMPYGRSGEFGLRLAMSPSR